MARTGNLKAMLTVLAVALALAFVALLAGRPTDAAPRFKVVTKTFSNAGQITIPAGAPATTSGAAAPYPSEINVGGFRRGSIRDVNLTLKNYTHTFPDDVDVLLVSRGRNAIVMSDVGGSDDVNNITLVLDDEAPGELPTGSQISAGTFKPTNEGAGDAFPAPAPTPSGASALSVFDRANPNATWRLLVFDDAGGDAGQFAGGWSLKIRARVLR